MATLKEVFDRQFEGVVFDRYMCFRIIEYTNRFMTKNPEHTEFFGGVFIGVNPIMFTEFDRESWYQDVLTVDETALKDDFKHVTDINPDFNVMSEPFNYTAFYVCHRLYQEGSIPLKLRHTAMVMSLVMLHATFLTSLLYHRFRKYQASREVAQAAYNTLTMRFDIRRYGSWRELLEARAEEILTLSGVYGKFIKDFKPDPKVIGVLTTNQGRIRKLINNLFSVYDRVRLQGDKVKAQATTMVTTDGEVIMRDRVNGYATYRRYLRRVVQERDSFIKDPLIKITLGAITNASEEPLRQALEYLSKTIGKEDYMDELVDDSVVNTFGFLSTQRTILRRNALDAIVAKIKIQLTAPRAGDPVVLRLRHNGDVLVKASIKRKTPSVIVSTRTAVLMYLVLRALTKDTYS